MAGVEGMKKKTSLLLYTILCVTLIRQTSKHLIICDFNALMTENIFIKHVKCVIHKMFKM